MTVHRGLVSVDGGPGVSAAVEPGEEALSIVPEGASPITLAYVDIDDLFDDDYTLRLTDHTGRRYDLSMFGKAYGQVMADVSKRRRELLHRDLLLTGVGKPEPFPGSAIAEGKPQPVELRLFDDLLVVMPERGVMWGLPYSFIDDVRWDQDAYRVTVVDDEGVAHEFGWLKKRSEQFRDQLRSRLEALAKRTASTLSALLPGMDPAELSKLAGLMRDGRAVQQRVVVEGISPALWKRLEEAVVGAGDRRESYEALKAMGVEGATAVGVKAVGEVSAEPDDSPAGATVAGSEDAAAPGARPDTRMWFFVPLKGSNALAHEVTSEESHATYVFRHVVPGDPERSIARLNRALLTLNFRREPIYAPQEEIESGRFLRYRVALRQLDYLRDTRAAFLGRAIHTDAERWLAQVKEAAARA